eukprot:6210285-Pleurochrysis_carterae.AAC.2
MVLGTQCAWLPFQISRATQASRCISRLIPDSAEHSASLIDPFYEKARANPSFRTCALNYNDVTLLNSGRMYIYWRRCLRKLLMRAEKLKSQSQPAGPRHAETLQQPATNHARKALITVRGGGVLSQNSLFHGVQLALLVIWQCSPLRHHVSRVP